MSDDDFFNLLPPHRGFELLAYHKGERPKLQKARHYWGIEGDHAYPFPSKEHRDQWIAQSPKTRSANDRTNRHITLVMRVLRALDRGEIPSHLDS